MNDSVRDYINSEMLKSNNQVKEQIDKGVGKASEYTDGQIKTVDKCLGNMKGNFNNALTALTKTLVLEIQKIRTENTNNYTELERKITESTNKFVRKQCTLEKKFEQCITLEDCKKQTNSAITKLDVAVSKLSNDILENKAQITENTTKTDKLHASIKQLRSPTLKSKKDKNIPNSVIPSSSPGLPLKRSRSSSLSVDNMTNLAKEKGDTSAKIYDVAKISNMKVDIITRELQFLITWGPGEDGENYDDTWVAESDMFFENIVPSWLKEFCDKKTYRSRCGKTFKGKPKSVVECHYKSNNSVCMNATIEIIDPSQMERMKARYEHGILGYIDISGRESTGDANVENKESVNDENPLQLQKEVRFTDQISGEEKITNSINELLNPDFLSSMDYNSFDNLLASYQKEESTSNEYKDSNKTQDADEVDEENKTINLIVKPGLNKDIKSGSSLHDV